MTVRPETARSFVAATAGAALLLALAWAAFAAWRDPLFVLTSFQGVAPAPPVYGFFLPRATLWVLLALGILGGLVGAAARLRRWRPASPALYLVCWILGAFAFHLAVHASRSGALPSPELATYAGETVLFDALEIDSAGAFLDRYAEIQPSLSLHGRTKPPGFALLYHFLLEHVSRRLEVLALLFTFLGSLLAWPTYVLARRLTPPEDEDGSSRAWAAAALAVTAPAAVLFGAVSLDAVFALAAAVAFALLAGELAAPRLGRRLVLGLVLSGSLLLSYSAFPVILLCVVALAVARWRRPGRLAADVGQVTAGILLPQVLLAVATGFDPWRTFLQARALNAASMTEMVGRDVTSWEVWAYVTPGNLLAFALFLGPALVAGLARLPGSELSTEARSLAVGFGVTLLVVSAGGLYLLETERIWLFLVPPAAALATRDRGLGLPFALAVTGATALLFETFLFTLK